MRVLFVKHFFASLHRPNIPYQVNELVILQGVLYALGACEPDTLTSRDHVVLTSYFHSPDVSANDILYE